ncbi:MAG: hypothetical protein ACOC83_05250, partial [Gemmatimonadota bacterium]
VLDLRGPDLAREAGVSPRRLDGIRRGTERPARGEVEALADVLARWKRDHVVDPSRADLAERVLRMGLEMGADGRR